MITKPNDHRHFRHVISDNGLNVLLVHDNTATQSAIALTIAAGHFQDPENCPGLAHLLEHCLFSGCNSYPKENYITDFIESSGGSINAWTAAEMTGFELTCQHQDLVTSGAMLANMLSEPLFPEQAVNKEIQAIHAEFTLKQHDEHRRIHQIDKETCNPNHPFHQFSSGHESIYMRFTPAELVQLLKTYHQNWYHAPLMQLCVISNLPLEHMQAQVLPAFDTISADYHRPLPSELLATSETPLYTNRELAKFIQIQTQKSINQLAISFLLPDIHQWYRTKPELFLSTILGNESEGSLYQWLTSQGWISSLSAGDGIQGSHFKDFTLSMQLTPQGRENVQHIAAALFTYLQLIRSEGKQSRYFSELQQLNLLEFTYQELPKPNEFANHIAVQMQYYPPEHYLCGEYLLDTHDFAPVQSLLDHMTPQNMRIRLAARDVDTNKTSQWHRIPYSVEAIPDNWLQCFEQVAAIEALHLPKPNPYITHDLSLVAREQEYTQPKKIVSTATREMWFGQDDEFDQPKSELFIAFESPAFNQDCATSATSKVWASSVQSWINQQFYDANSAGLYSHLYPHKRGFTLHCAGFSEHLTTVATHIIDAIHSPETVQAHVNKAKAQRLSTLKNSVLNRPINRLFATLNTLLHNHSYLPEELAEFAEQANSDHVIKTATKLSDSFYQSLCFGNWQKQNALALDEHLAQHQTAKSDTRTPYQILDLRHVSETRVQLPCSHSDAAFVQYLQGLNPTAFDKAICVLLEHLLSPNYFHYMRVQHKFGYEVGCGYLPYFNVPGLALYTQSPTANAHELISATDEFLAHMPGLIANLSPDLWQKATGAVTNQFVTRDQNFAMKCQRLWTAMDTENQGLSEHSEIAAQLQQITPDIVATYLATLIERQQGNLTLFAPGAFNNAPKSMQQTSLSAAQFQLVKQQCFQLQQKS